MQVDRLKPKEALESMLDWSGMTLSLVLPFGIPGDTEDATRIERKNTLKAAEEKLKPLEEETITEILEKIASDHEDASKHFTQKDLPATLMYFINSSGKVILTELHSAMRSYFYLGEVPELEPLVYTTQSSPNFNIIKLDLEDPQVMRFSDGQLTKLNPCVNNRISEAYGSSWSNLKLSKVIEIADRNNDSGTHLDKGHPNNTYGYSSRQKTHKEKNLEFWMKILSEVLKDTLDQEKDAVFVLATDDNANLFFEINPKLKHEKLDQVYAISELEKGRDFVHELTRKVNLLAEQEQVAARSTAPKPEERVGELIHLLDTGLAKQLLVREHDWFNERAKGRTDYERSNSRSPVILKAVKKRVPVNFTKENFANDEGMAAYSYGT